MVPNASRFPRNPSLSTVQATDTVPCSPSCSSKSIVSIFRLALSPETRAQCAKTHGAVRRRNAFSTRGTAVMKSETLVQQHPPTPPVASTDMQIGLHQIAQYNTDGHYSYDDPQSYGAIYGSLGRGHDALPRHPSHDGGQPGEAYGLGIQYVSIVPLFATCG